MISFHHVSNYQTIDLLKVKLCYKISIINIINDLNDFFIYPLMSCLTWFQNIEITAVPNLSICFNDGKLRLSILD